MVLFQLSGGAATTRLGREAARLMAAAALLVVGGCSSSNAPPASSGSGGAQATGGTSGGSGGAPGSGGAGGSALDAATGDAADSSLPQDTASTDAPGDASSDGDGGGALTLTLPIQRGDLDVFEFGSLMFKMQPSLGARITSFQLDGDELLTGPTENPMYFGSTLWPSPADDWVLNMFAAPAIIDNQPYTTTVGADGVITSTSAAYTTPKNNKKLSVAKIFHADTTKQSITIDYTITNLGTTPYQIGHWEVTRVFPGGLTFFPTGTMSQVDFSNAGEPQVMKLQLAQGYTWYDNKTHMAGKGSAKSGSETEGGFIAHVAPNPKGDLLFVKTFKPIVPPSMPPPGHFDVEMFCNDPPTYIELEEHSAYETVMPGATYTATVHWYLHRLPIGTDRSVGSAALIAAVKQLLGN
ncbi:MAG TPA: DUF4380 domain-containing protein [Polyangia bacterium]|jgi:hypothetical protein|nr:DUF4380 domain-containing protein [Polyangia bacterium]